MQLNTSGYLGDLLPLEFAALPSRNQDMTPQLSPPVMVRVQNPIVLDERSEPQPDITLVKRANHADRHPLTSC